MGTFALIFFGILFLLFVFAILDASKKADDAAETRKALAQASGRAESLGMVGGSGKDGFALTHDRKGIVLVKYGIATTHPAANIVGAEVLKDGLTIVKTNRGSQIAGAALGAALLGPLGLLVGGVTGSKREVEKIRSLTLRIVLRNEFQEFADVELYKGPAKPADHLRTEVRRAEDAVASINSLIG